MAMKVSTTRVHTLIGHLNRFLICKECEAPVPYWHNPKYCKCDDGNTFNHPCEHSSGVISLCPTWTPYGECQCIDKENHDT